MDPAIVIKCLAYTLPTLHVFKLLWTPAISRMSLDTLIASSFSSSYLVEDTRQSVENVGYLVDATIFSVDSIVNA
jgi:hypothetical protein